MSQLKLISFNLCPFVQRSVITLEEKKVPYEIEYIDLSAKPDWFLKISPFGKVPVLKVDRTVVFESAVINEYLDETSGEYTIHPKDPLKKAYHRSWIEYSSSVVVDQFLLSMSQSKEEFHQKAESLGNKLLRLEEQLLEGPFFAGEQFSLVDAATAPALQRMEWMEKIYPQAELFKKIPKVKEWSEACLKRPSVIASTVSNIEDIFRQYLKGKGSPTRNEQPVWLASLL